MKLYIILTYDIHTIGGTQTYTWGKTEYLERHGWKTAVFYPGYNQGVSPYAYLNKYICGGVPSLDYDPSKLSSKTKKYIIRRLLKAYNLDICKYDEIIVESHYDTVALWSEIIADYCKGKHICFCCSEYFDEPRIYRKHIDFFKYKYDRHELYGINPSSMSVLFNGCYTNIPTEENDVFRAFSPSSVVADIKVQKLDKLKKADWVIVYFGRSQKRYFDVIMKDISRFASEYTEKEIQLIIVGNIVGKEDYIISTFRTNNNLEVIPLGDMSPVPLKVFKIANVVIAGAGCARWSYLAGAYTIIADAKEGECANGVLGYETTNTLYAEDTSTQKSFYEYMKKVLVDKEYEFKERIVCYPNTKIEENDVDDRYDEHFTLIEKSSPILQYFVFQGKGVIKDQIKALLFTTPLFYLTFQKIINLVKK